MTSKAFEDLKADFEFIDDWEERYKYVIELGKKMPDLPEAEHTEANKVHGCVSQVWLKTEIRKDDAGNQMFYFEGDSDAMIVRGLVAILRIMLCDIPPGEVVQTDATAELAAIGLSEHLTQQRSNGLVSMVKRLKEDAAKAG